MKRKLNMALTIAILGILGTAYGTCYLNKVVLCVGTGDSVASFSTTCSGSGTATFSYAVIADEGAWRFDVYSVTRGGLHTEDLNITKSGFYCDNSTSNPFFNDTPYQNYGFNAHYIDPCSGSRVTNANAPGSASPFNTTFSSPHATTVGCVP